MTTTGSDTVSVSRRIEAPAAQLFALLSDPASHPSFDGSGMVRDGRGNRPVSGVGDVFTMKMHNEEMGDYEMSNHVVEYVPNERIVWQPVMSAATRPEDIAAIGDSARQRWGYQLEADGPNATIVTELFDCTESPEWLRTAVDGGNGWLPAMRASLEALDARCSSSSTAGATSA